MTAARPLNILYLATDAYGGFGGIALHSRDVIEALAADPAVAGIVALPRLAEATIGPLPAKLDYDLSGLGGTARYTGAVLRRLARERFDLVICAHVNLAPLGWLAARLKRARLMVVAHGVEVWPAAASARKRLFLARADAVLAVSGFTRDRLLDWCPIAPERIAVVNNAIHLDHFSPGPKDAALLARYGLAGRSVIMTLGRLAAGERYKGFDEIIDLLPALARQRPEIAYLIVGGGDDMDRLRAKAAALGVGDRVIFAGRIPEEEKVATYRLADVFALPSYGEGFGFVLLEAMACGIPAIASCRDGGQDAVRGGAIGQVVDPHDAAGLEAAILRAINQPKAVPAGIEYFSYAAYGERVRALIHRTVCR